ncbi:hypothetical protein BDZ94DRAFT_614326 [Collybia nuda]|uniref:Uncharacterized protein n=1 Tax=Collybia nuda TaxID=64659 RepID=A0A9P5Y9C3_9AGAR|nr:hypothetical protein BDZ94DRAFT_614326 [Collybia nuda]
MAASFKSPTSFTLGPIILKGGEVVSTGLNHQRVHHSDFFEVSNTADWPVFIHAIFNAIGDKAPSRQVAGSSESFILIRLQMAPTPLERPRNVFHEGQGGASTLQTAAKVLVVARTPR